MCYKLFMIERFYVNILHNNVYAYLKQKGLYDSELWLQFNQKMRFINHMINNVLRSLDNLQKAIPFATSEYILVSEK